jgi:hypothetical protein
VLRFQVSEDGQPALPAVDIADAVVLIGSATGARIRLPSWVARDTHVRIDAATWVALADVRADGVARPAGDGGSLGAGMTFELGPYRVRVAPAPPGTAASPPQRTESLARELVRSLLGSSAAPSLEVERGPLVGASRALPPPEAILVIGRGDDAGWVILDEDLSRLHLEVRRGWDGITARDLESKNGTRVGGVRITGETELSDGDRIELGNVVLRFRDPAERHLRGEPSKPARAAVPKPRPAAASAWPFAIAVVIAGVAVAGLVWVLAS